MIDLTKQIDIIKSDILGLRYIIGHNINCNIEDAIAIIGEQLERIKNEALDFTEGTYLSELIGEHVAIRNSNDCKGAFSTYSDVVYKIDEAYKSEETNIIVCESKTPLLTHVFHLNDSELADFKEGKPVKHDFMTDTITRYSIYKLIDHRKVNTHDYVSCEDVFEPED